MRGVFRLSAAKYTAITAAAATSENVAGALWAKLMLNCAYNAMSAIAQVPYGRLIRGEGVEAVMRDVVRECLDQITCLFVLPPFHFMEPNI